MFFLTLIFMFQITSQSLNVFSIFFSSLFFSFLSHQCVTLALLLTNCDVKPAGKTHDDRVVGTVGGQGARGKLSPPPPASQILCRSKNPLIQNALREFILEFSYYALTLFGTGGDTFIPLSFLSDDFVLKIPKLFWR